MKKITYLVLLVAGMSMSTFAQAQVNIPVSSVSLEFPGAPAVAIHIGATNRNVIPTPFLIAGQTAKSRSWLCMDPLQNIYYGGASATVIQYASFNPSDFDLWNPNSPGLSTARIQNLADLFTAYWPPVVDNVLTSAALQLAVWEITNEWTGNPFDLTTGAFTATSNASVVQAQTFLNSLNNLGIKNVGNVAGLSFLIDGTLSPGGNMVQDLVGWNPSVTTRIIIPVPEPSTYGAFAALGLVGVAALRRRRIRALSRS